MAGAIEAVRALLDAPGPRSLPVVDALFRAERIVPDADVVAGLGVDGRDALVDVGLLRAIDAGMVGTARLTRFGGRLIASDRLGFRNHGGFVLAPGPATVSLAAAVRPLDGGRALDLGCGPGSLALWLAASGADVVGLDVSERALAFAAFNRRLNAAAQTSFGYGDFLTAPPDPALDGRFDVCVANPPFVLAPRSALVYRDSPLPRDETTRVALERVHRTLAPGGRGYIIGSWVDDGTGRWDARPGTWLRGLDGRAIVTRISSVTPDAYATSWTRDLDEPARGPAAAAWRGFLHDQGIGRVTTGIIAVAAPRRRAWGRGAVKALETGRPGWRAIEAILAGR